VRKEVDSEINYQVSDEPSFYGLKQRRGLTGAKELGPGDQNPQGQSFDRGGHGETSLPIEKKERGG